MLATAGNAIQHTQVIYGKRYKKFECTQNAEPHDDS
jgi:hypothetical protein